MHIRCPICGEPYDQDELHNAWIPSLNKAYPDVRLSYGHAVKLFREQGCELFGTTHNWSADPDREADDAALCAATLFDLLADMSSRLRNGDDIDGVCAELEDFGF